MNSPTEDVGTKQGKKKRRQDVTKNVVEGKNVGLVAAGSYKSSGPAAGGTGKRQSVCTASPGHLKMRPRRYYTG